MSEASDLLGPSAHARSILADEPLLWAAHSRHYRYDVKGLDEENGTPVRHPNLKAAVGVVDRMIDDEPTTHQHTVADVFIVGGSPDSIAVRLALGRFRISGPTHLWALTPARLHVATVLDPPPPEATAPAGFLGTLAKIGKSLVTDEPADRPTVTRRPLQPEFDIPAHQMRMSLGKRKTQGKKRPCLRVDLPDASAFELFFGDHTDPEQYDHLFARTRGAR